MVTFSKDFTFQISYCFRKAIFFQKYFFRRFTISQLHFISIATIPIYQFVITGARYKLGTVKSWEFFLMYILLAQRHIIDVFYLISWLHKVLQTSYVLSKLLFQSLYILRKLISMQLYVLNELLFRKMLLFRTANI